MRRRAGRTRRQREGGFALLLVFLMAAVIGITLYMALPRLAFDVQRQKEQLLVERGQQYQIAIRRYMQRGMKQGVNQVVGPPWPARIEDLENTNGRRFLRKRYIDPMTGKDEWRIIHINNGVLTDSINNKPQQNNQQQEGLRPGGIAEFAGMGQMPAGPSGVSPAQLRKRPSDSAGTGGGLTGDPSLPANAAGSGGAVFPPVGPAAPGLSPGVQPVPNPAQVPPQPGAGPSSGSGNWGQSSSFGSNTPPTGQPAFPGQIGPPANSNNPGGSPYPAGPNFNGNPPFFPQPGTTPGGQFSPQQLIGSILTQPRPGGMPTAVPNSNSTIGGGIAGIASKLDDDSIMVCGDHTNYQEWEFIFDPSKWKAPADPRKVVVGTPAGNNPSTSATPGSGTSQSSQPNMGGPGGPSASPATGQNQNRTGISQGGNAGAVCGMESRPGTQ